MGADASTPFLFETGLTLLPNIIRIEQAEYGDSQLAIRGGVVLEGGMVVVPLAAESLGVRSLSVFVRTPDTGVLIDPGVALGTRGGLHPHPAEYRALAQRRAAI